MNRCAQTRPRPVLPALALITGLAAAASASAQTTTYGGPTAASAPSGNVIIGTTSVMAAPATERFARRFPANALRGLARFGAPPELSINGKAARLAPGARIRGLDDLLVLTGQATGLKANIHYTIEPTTGLVMDVWLITAAEQAHVPWPQTPAEAAAWRFDPLSQTWTKP